MSRIDKLVARLCPEGVEYREVQELFVTKNGYTPSKTNQASGLMEQCRGSEWMIFVRTVES